MPELPEVEQIRRSLLPLRGRLVEGVRVHRRDVVVLPGDPPGGWSRSQSDARPRRLLGRHLLVGGRIERLWRHGKRLALIADDGRAVEVGLGMTGQLLAVGAGERLEAHGHAHVLWRLDDGGRLVFRDARRFGGLWAFEHEADLRAKWAALGPDALDVDAAELRRRLSRTARPVAVALMDQRLVAGLGNIYVQEALFGARIPPRRPANDLGAVEVSRLAAEVHAVLGAAIEAGGSSLRDYVDASGARGEAVRLHRVYGKGGEACPACGRVLERLVLGGRSVVWCPFDQGS